MHIPSQKKAARTKSGAARKFWSPDPSALFWRKVSRKEASLGHPQLSSTWRLLRSSWPEVRRLIRPRAGRLGLAFFLICIQRMAGFVLPLSMKYVIDLVIGQNRGGLLAPLIVLLLAAMALQGAAGWAVARLVTVSGAELMAGLRRRIQAHLVRLPVAFYDANATGTLITRVFADLEGVRNLIGGGLMEFFGASLTAVVAVLVMLRISPLLTALAIGVMITAVLVVSWALATTVPILREHTEMRGRLTERLNETLSGIRVVKGYHAESCETAVFSAGIQRLHDNLVRLITAISMLTLTSTILLGIVGAAVTYVGSTQVLIGRLSLGDFVTFTVLLGYLILPAAQISELGGHLTEAVAGLSRACDVLRENPEDQNLLRSVALGPICGGVVFDDVSFAYKEGPPVLCGISFEAGPDTVTALVGPSGSGKSTITSLIAAFYEPTAGCIRIDGTDLSTVRLSSYRTQLGLVLQDTFLFDGSIRENVAFGRPEASDAEVLLACRTAHVDEFAKNLEHGYDTLVGERGVRLSGGQRQRVSIARAILADPRILILDEATSSLDPESESSIQQGLSHLMRGRTTFVIAHRFSTICRADQILVIDAGKIVERGTHDRLYAAEGRYFELCSRQHHLDGNVFLPCGENGLDANRASGTVPADCDRYL